MQNVPNVFKSMSYNAICVFVWKTISDALNLVMEVTKILLLKFYQNVSVSAGMPIQCLANSFKRSSLNSTSTAKWVQANQLTLFPLKFPLDDLWFSEYFKGNRSKLICLTLSWRRSLSYRNQSIDLLRKSMDWFLFDNGLRHERVKC